MPSYSAFPGLKPFFNPIHLIIFLIEPFYLRINTFACLKKISIEQDFLSVTRWKTKLHKTMYGKTINLQADTRLGLFDQGDTN